MTRTKSNCNTRSKQTIVAAAAWKGHDWSRQLRHVITRRAGDDGTAEAQLRLQADMETIIGGDVMIHDSSATIIYIGLSV